MASYKIILDVAEDVEELSAILNTHDNSGDVDADTYIKAGAVCAALAFCNSKPLDSDRGDYKPQDYIDQMTRINGMITDDYEGDSYSVVRTSMDLFITSITTSLILSMEDQSKTPLFKSIKDDLSLVFTVLDGKNETENLIGVPTIK